MKRSPKKQFEALLQGLGISYERFQDESPKWWEGLGRRLEVLVKAGYQHAEKELDKQNETDEKTENESKDESINGASEEPPKTA